MIQSLLQQIGKEVVITVPASLVVEGDNEQVAPFEIFQGFLPGSGRRAEQDCITKGTA